MMDGTRGGEGVRGGEGIPIVVLQVNIDVFTQFIKHKYSKNNKLGVDKQFRHFCCDFIQGVDRSKI